MYRFSDRLAALIAPENSFSVLLGELQAAGSPLLDLTISNPTEALADYPHKEISNALNSVTNFRYRPTPFGDWNARTAIVNHLEARDSGLRLSPRHVALTASTSEAYGILFKLLANPGDEVLVPTPSYPLFDYLAQLEAVKLQRYELRYDGTWHIDFASLAAGVSERTRAVILVNPNNPTGSFAGQAEMERLVDFAVARNLPLVSDEVFIDYAFNGSAGSMATLNGREDALIFTLNGLSKSAGMPQMKLAWLIVNGPDSEREAACLKLELILDTYLSVGAPVQLAAKELLGVGSRIQEQIHQRLGRNVLMLDGLLGGRTVHRLHSEGGWSAILRVPAVLSEEVWIHRLLREHQVVIQPGYFFDLRGGCFLVISLLTPEDEFQEGVRRILKLALEAG